jgi:uncharacterized repeat protein (TIGR04076 family)
MEICPVYKEGDETVFEGHKAGDRLYYKIKGKICPTTWLQWLSLIDSLSRGEKQSRKDHPWITVEGKCKGVCSDIARAVWFEMKRVET